MKNIKISNKLLSLLLSGTLAFSLVGCKGKKSEYIPFNEIFYDANMEGIDDAFEERISNSQEQINDVEVLEKTMSLIHELTDIDYKGVEEEYSIPYLMENSSNLSLDDLSQIEENLNAYNELKEGTSFWNKNDNSDEMDELRRELYKSLLLLLNYVRYHANTTLYNFGRALYDSIILDAGSYDGNEKNVYAIICNYEGGTIPYSNYAVYDNSATDTHRVIGIEENSPFYRLVLETSRYQDFEELPVSYEVFISYSKDDKKAILEELEQYERSMDLFKESMIASYEVRKHEKSIWDYILFFSDEKEYEYDMVCDGPDKDSIKNIKK